MSDRPTPRTDYFCRKLKPSLDNWNKWQRTASFAARLECELDEAREQRDRLAQVIEAATVLIAAKGRHNTMLAYEGLRDALVKTRDNQNQDQ